LLGASLALVHSTPTAHSDSLIW